MKSGETHSGGLTEPGTYWVRFKTDNTDDSKTNWRSVTIQEYFTVTAVPDSVSTNRVVFTESPAYVTLIKGRVWLVPAGSKINVTASSANTKYYKINRITLENLAKLLLTIPCAARYDALHHPTRLSGFGASVKRANPASFPGLIPAIVRYIQPMTAPYA